MIQSCSPSLPGTLLDAESEASPSHHHHKVGRSVSSATLCLRSIWTAFDIQKHHSGAMLDKSRTPAIEGECASLRYQIPRELAPDQMNATALVSK